MFQPLYVPYCMTVPTAHINVQVAASPLAVTFTTVLLAAAGLRTTSILLPAVLYQLQYSWLSSRQPLSS